MSSGDDARTATDTVATDTAPDGGTDLTDTSVPVDPGETAITHGMRSILRVTVINTVRIGVREYRLAVRRHWTVGAAGLFTLFSVALVLIGGTNVGPTRVPAVLASFAQLGVYLVPLVALAVGFDTVVGADESGSLETLLTLPLSNTAVIVGKYLGRAVALAGGMLVGFAIGGALLVRFAGIGVLGAYATVALAAVAAAFAFLGVSVLASTLASEKTHALGAVLAAWVWFVLVHDLVVLGVVASLNLPQSMVSVAVLANPADLFRVLVLRGVSTTAGGVAGVLAGTGLTFPVLVGALAAWIVIPVSMAVFAFQRRAV